MSDFKAKMRKIRFPLGLRPKPRGGAYLLDLLTAFKGPTSKGGWLGSRVVSVSGSGAEGPWFKSQSRRCRVTVLGQLFTPIVPLFTKQQNW